MAAGEDSGDDELDNFLLSEEDFVEALGEGAEVLCCISDLGLGGVVHGSRIGESEEGGKILLTGELDDIAHWDEERAWNHESEESD